MKRLALFTGALFLFAAGSLDAQGNFADSKHDGSSTARTQWLQTGTGPCAACHTPHVDAALDYPLWDHAPSATTQNWTMYTSSSMDAAAVDHPTGGSLLCMGCHDGQTALDNYGGTVDDNQTMTAAFGSSAANFGLDMRNEHPISIEYTATLVSNDGELNTGSTVSALLKGGFVQCSSCHEPHFNGYGTLKSLVQDNSDSSLCTTCHNK